MAKRKAAAAAPKPPEATVKQVIVQPAAQEPPPADALAPLQAEIAAHQETIRGLEDTLAEERLAHQNDNAVARDNSANLHHRVLELEAAATAAPKRGISLAVLHPKLRAALTVCEKPLHMGHLSPPDLERWKRVRGAIEDVAIACGLDPAQE